MAEPRRGRVGRRADHAFRHDRLRRPLRLRAEGLRPDGLDRPQAGAAHGQVLAARALGGSHGRGGQRHLDRGGTGARRRGGGDGDRRAVRLRELLPDSPRARAGPHEPLRDRSDHPQHGGRLGLDGARRTGTARGRVHGVRRIEHGDRRRPRRDPPRACRRRCSAAAPRRPSRASASRASRRCERCRDGTPTRRRRRDRSTRAATAS